MSSDVLKQVEEALEGAVDDLTRCNSMPEREPLFAALTALSGLEWKEIAEMANPEPTTCRVGRYLESGAWDMNDLRNGTFAAACDLHPLLPPDPADAAETGGGECWLSLEIGR